MLTIYQRLKNNEGKWRYEGVEEKRGFKTGGLVPPFYVRVTIEGKQQWHRLQAETYEAAKTEATRAGHALDADRKGLTVAEVETITNRVPFGPAIEHYLSLKEGKARRTLAQYRLTLEQFRNISGAKFVDEVNVSMLRKYKTELHKQGYAGKTQDTRLNVVFFMLKKFNNPARLPKDEMPIVEEEDAKPYTDEELEKLFAAMDDGERIRFKFFLGSACREQEVQYAEWKDLDLTAKTYHVRQKPEVGFTPKTHEDRTIPLPTSLVESLKQIKKKADLAVRWVFPSKNGLLDGHFLRKLKKIADRAGLNCGHCDGCENRDECEQFYLHRFRKTCATRWQEAGVPMRTLQKYLGHKSLETTMRYLGETHHTKLRPQIDRAFGD